MRKDGLRRVRSIHSHYLHHPFHKPGQPGVETDTPVRRRVK